MYRTAILILLTGALPISAASGPVCIENASETPWYFVAHADGGPRQGGPLDPGEQICSTGGPMGTVAVFASPDDLEGCSRRVPAGAVERLIDFPHVDLCRWERAD